MSEPKQDNEAACGRSDSTEVLGVDVATDWKLLLTKYAAHVSAAEGECFALSTNIAPCSMLNLEFTEEEKILLNVVFAAVRNWAGTLSPIQRKPLPIEQLFDA